MTQKNFKVFFTIYFILFGVIISIFGGIISYNFQLNSLKNDLDTKADEIIMIKKFTILKEKIDSIDNIVYSIAKNLTMKNYLNTKDQHKLYELENIFLSIANINTKIMQLRYIDQNGMEIVRVDRTNEQNEPFVVQNTKLQDKKHRDYFQIVSQMKEQKVWHSRFDLNIEHGKIEVPYRPTLRVALPLLTKQNEFIGMIIVNILTTNLFKTIRNSSTFEHYIIDKDGHYIIHPDEQYSFNKYTGANRTLSQDFPKDSAKILSHPKNCNECYVYTLDDILHNDDKATMVLKARETYKDTLLNDKLQSTLYIILLSILASLFIAFFASIRPAQLQKALLSANKELKKFASILDKYVVFTKTKKDTTILEVSNAFEVVSGYSKDELIGQKMSIVQNPKTPDSYFKQLWKMLIEKGEWNGEVLNKNKEGNDFWLEQHIIIVKDENEEVEFYVSVGQDITFKKELEKLSSMDKLTGISNRRKLDESLDYQIDVTKRYNKNLSLIIIDIDNFKIVNDEYGHQMGDKVLFEVTKIISQIIRKIDIFGRFGGEEFLLICPETDTKQAFNLAEKIRVKIANYNFDKIGQKTISLGISQFISEDTAETLIKKADIALYESKNNGKNQSTIYFI